MYTPQFDRKALPSLTSNLLALFMLSLFSLPSVQAANIITFDDNATSCGGSVLCSTNGTTGYTGTVAFDLSTIQQWFQIDPDGISHLAGQVAEPNGGAGQFLVVNDTGSTVTSFSLTLIDTFTASTPSVTFCSGSSGPLCDNFQANKGAAAPSGASESLSGPDFFSCTNPNGANPCTSTAGQAAANFMPNLVTFSWSGLNIANGATFDIGFASWNNDVYATPEPSFAIPLGAGFLALIGTLRFRRNRQQSVG